MPELFMEIFAHYDILKDQLRPAPGNVPELPLFHLYPVIHQEKVYNSTNIINGVVLFQNPNIQKIG